MSDIDKITDNFTFLYFKKTFLTCSLCAPEGQKGRDVVSKDGWFNASIALIKSFSSGSKKHKTLENKSLGQIESAFFLCVGHTVMSASKTVSSLSAPQI